MRSRRRKLAYLFSAIFLFGLVFIFIFSQDKALGYDTGIAHPNIAEIAASLYNQKFNNTLTQEEIGWIKQGAMDEDTPTRWLNHFYDPVYNKGLRGKYLSAKDWSTNFLRQQNFSLGDKSWQRALNDFKKGDEESAFKELGHVLHLVADMAVPAHTREDIHVVGDSYEQFVKNNWSEMYKKFNYSFITVNSLAGAFDSLANYSNNNFYSDDTVVSSKYKVISDLSEEIIDGGNEVYYKFFITNSTYAP